jgi:aspartate racemase
MKTIGLIGGMSWESSAEYYRIINQTVRDRVHALENAKSVMVTVNFHEIERLQHSGDWDKAAEILAASARQLEAAGADCVVLCTNTMHKLSSAISQAVAIPLLHIADATAKKILEHGIKRIGLLGTGFTMEHEFYKGRLEQLFGLEVLTPDKSDRDIVHGVIYDELVSGVVSETSRLEYRRIMAGLVAAGAEGIILGCTEIMLLVGQQDSSVHVFDTTTIHAVGAVDFALQ